MSSITYPSSREKNIFDQLLRALLIGALLFALSLVFLLVSFQVLYSGRIYPGVSVSGVNVSGMTPQQAGVAIGQHVDYPDRGRIIFRDGSRTWQVSPARLGFFVDPGGSAMQAFNVGRQGSIFERLYDQFAAAWQGYSLPAVIVYDQKRAQQYVLDLAKQVDQPVLEASLGLNGPEVVVHSGQVGREMDVPATLKIVNAQLQTLTDGIIPLRIKETPPVILDANQQADVARRILSDALTLTMPDPSENQGPWTFDRQTLANMLTIQRIQTGTTAEYQVGLNGDALRSFLTDLSPKLSRNPQNARFTFNDQTHQLDLIQHAIIGRALNVDATVQSINEKLLQGVHSVPLVLDTNEPAVTDSATADSLGIHELVSQQTSYFYGSAADRVQNIQTASARFMGLLVAPGEVFSMGQAIGDISLENGYAEALIIVGNQTIQGVGGGVCQVSTTLFRTAFFGGFPIVERHAHAYRVYYYEKVAGNKINPKLAGLDATVYFPLVDFKFKNDTPNWLLMETYVNPAASSLTWKFYSTSDGRTVDWTSTGPVNVVPAPPPSYKENPDLKKGQIKQVDYAADGADVTVTRTVTRDGQVIINDTIQTHYLPWQAKYEYGPGTEDIPTPSPDQ
jgi:vancomycin resistance protein YoaR